MRMKNIALYLKRGLSLVLVLALMLSFAAPGGAFWAHAYEEASATMTDGEIIANNYDALSAAEKALLNSRLLAGEGYTYTAPADADGLVSVDIDLRTITALPYTGDGYTWHCADTADIVVGGETVEQVTLADGKGSYRYEGNAFSVRVDYSVTTRLPEDTQRTLLAAPGWLSVGVENLETVAGQSGNLYILEQAMPELVNLANKGISLGNTGATASLSAEGKAGINALNQQMRSNGGKLTLSLLAEEYANYYKTEFLLTRGTEVQTAVTDFVNNIKAVNEALNMIAGNVETFIKFGFVSAATGEQIKSLAGITSGLYNALSGLESGGWIAAEKGTVLLKDNMNDEDYAALDGLVLAIERYVDMENVEILPELTMDTAEVQLNMSMCNVTVTAHLSVVAEGTDTAELVEYASTEPVVITLAAGTTAAELQAAVAATGVEEQAKLGWADVYSEEHFDTIVTSNLPEELTEDLEYSISFTPKHYAVTLSYDGARVLSLPYGYRLTLPRHGGTELVYDYSVDGGYVPEGAVWTVEGDAVIDRTTGDPYTESDLYRIAANLYCTMEEATILTSGALLGNEDVDVRYPDKKYVESLIALEDDVLTVQRYPASYHGLEWVPYTYTVVSPAGSGTTYYFNDADTVAISEAGYDRVDVVYTLALTNFGEERVLDVLNLPYILNEEAKGQLGALNKINGYRTQMGQLNKTMLGALKGVIQGSVLSADPETNARLKAEFAAVLDGIIANCIDTDGRLKFYNMLESYNSEGLSYYYRNSAAVLAELELLSGYLTEMLSGEEKSAALVTLMTNNGFGSYADKLTTLESAMAEVKADLKAPNAVINCSSDNLYKLTDALNAENVNEHRTVNDPALTLTAAALSVTAGTTVAISFKVTIDGTPIYTEPVSFEKTDVLTAAQVSSLLAGVASVVGGTLDAGVQKYYDTNYSAAALSGQLVGMTALEAYRAVNGMTLAWTAKVYTVHVDGMDDQYVTVNSAQIKLAASPTVDERYEYVIGGQTVPAGVYTFTPKELTLLFTGGELQVERKVTNVRQENLVTMVDKLNASVGSDAVIFALYQHTDGDYSIVMRVDGSDAGAMQAGIMGAAMGLVNSGYSYVALDGHPVLYLDDVSGLRISLQAVMDAVMHSGMGSETILNVMDANGNINHMVIDGEAISLTDLPNVGGELIATTMQLGNHAGDATNVDFYITLGETSGELLALRNQLSGELGEMVSFVLADGELKLNVTLPDKAYQTYLAMLLITDGVELTDMDAVNGEIAFRFLQDLLSPVLVEGVTVQAYLNSLEMMGVVGSAESKAEYEALYGYLCETYANMTFTYDANSCLCVGYMPIDGLLGSMGGSMADMTGMITEKDTGIALKTRITLNNIGNEYDILYLDTAAANTIDQFGLTKLNGAASYEAGAVVVLLKDVKADLIFKDGALLNLNGYTLTGDVICSGDVYIVDTSGDKTGKIGGTVSGSYTMSADNDYSMRKDSNGDLIMTIDAGALSHAWSQEDITGLVVEVAADLLFNGYASSKLYLDGEKVYEIAVEDLLGLIAGSDSDQRMFEVLCSIVDSEALERVVNAIIGDATDFATLARAVESGVPLLKYQLTTANWTIATAHVADEDYVTVNLLPGEDRLRTLKVVVGGSDADRQGLIDLLTVLADTTVVEAGVTMSQSNANKTLRYDWNSRGSALVDMAADAEYALAVCALLAEGMDENGELIAGILSYYETNSLAKLEKAFNALTVEQFVTAINALDYEVSFDDVLSRLGLTGKVDTDSIKVNGVLLFLKQMAQMLGLTGGAESHETMESCYDPTQKGYNLTGSGSSDTFSTALSGGYALEMHLSGAGWNLLFKLFDADKMIYDIVVSRPGEDPVYEGSDFSAAFGSVDGDGYTVKINTTRVTMTGTVMVAYDITLKGASRLQQAGCCFLLSTPGAAISTDTELAVYSAADGYIVKQGDSFRYYLDEIDAPAVTGPVADCWMGTMTVGNAITRYLFLDIDPKKGATFGELQDNMDFTDLEGYRLTIDVKDNDGTALMKTGDKMTVEVADEVTIVAYVTYTVIVTGDTNCDGLIQAGDAVVMNNIYNGNSRDYSHEVMLAADTNRSGTVEFPAIESGDAVRIMNKYFDWAGYVEALKKQ